MQISARNQLRGKVIEIERGVVTAKVRIDVGGGNRITSTVTIEAVDELGLQEGSAVTAFFKASNVMLATD